MSKHLYAGLAAVGLIFVAGSAAALTPASVAAVAQGQTPRSQAAIPLFPGLTPVGEEAIPLDRGTFLVSDWGGVAYPKLTGAVRSYVTTAPAEEVYAFYQQRLGGKIETSSEDEDHNEIAPGGSTPVDRTYHPHRLEPTENILTNRAISTAMQRQMLSSNRPASADGDWLHDGSFQWVVKDRNGALTAFNVEVADESVASNWTGYAARTVVRISVETYGPIADD